MGQAFTIVQVPAPTSSGNVACALEMSEPARVGRSDPDVARPAEQSAEQRTLEGRRERSRYRLRRAHPAAERDLYEPAEPGVRFVVAGIGRRVSGGRIVPGQHDPRHEAELHEHARRRAGVDHRCWHHDCCHSGCDEFRIRKRRVGPPRVGGNERGGEKRRNREDELPGDHCTGRPLGWFDEPPGADAAEASVAAVEGSGANPGGVGEAPAASESAARTPTGTASDDRSRSSSRSVSSRSLRGQNVQVTSTAAPIASTASTQGCATISAVSPAGVSVVDVAVVGSTRRGIRFTIVAADAAAGASVGCGKYH